MAKITDDVLYGRAALKLGEPWITPGSLEHLKSIVQPGWKVFEWGSGGSTAFWARHCAFVVSIEHNLEWVQRTFELLKRLDVPRHKAQLQWWPGKDDKFKSYATAIQPYRNLDLVFVDGEASSRGHCLNYALSHVKPGGYLLLDNSNWLKRDLGEQWERTDYVEKDLKWIGQSGTFDWWTSILRKRE
ncbi:hypothetical protein GF380_01515 [Candidatus Uhrbacteria bacterium]|nr:hypothetical protein [Candidatus Uhrbacteria bacterium]